MVAFFQSLEKTLAAGVGLLILIMLLVGLATGQFVRLGDPLWWAFFMRWLHVLSGVMWIGLLWYLNFVQTPTMPKIEPVEHRAAVIKFIAPNVMFWFRYGALATVVTGLLLATQNGYIIWPNQQKVLGLVTASPDEKAAAARLAGLTSRVNTMLSIPMLYCMVAQ